MIDDASLYDALLHRYTGKNLAAARALEIGFGQRPFRLFWLIALGHDVEGIDIDRPVLVGGLSEIVATFREQGILIVGSRDTLRLVTHFDFADEHVDVVAQAFERALCQDQALTTGTPG